MNKDPQFSKDNRQIFFELILPKINQYDYNNIYLSSHSAGCVTCLRIGDEYYKENKENNLYLILYNPWCQWDKGEYEFTDKGKPNFWKIPLTTSIEWKNLLDSFQGKKTDTIGKHVIWNSKPYNIPKDRIHCKRDKNDYFASVDLNYNDNGRKVKLDVEYLEGEESLKEKLLIYRHFLTNFIEGDFIEYYDEEKLIEKFSKWLKSDEGIEESLNIINEKLETINNICDHMEKNNSYIGDVYISLKRQKEELICIKNDLLKFQKNKCENKLVIYDSKSKQLVLYENSYEIQMNNFRNKYLNKDNMIIEKNSDIDKDFLLFIHSTGALVAASSISGFTIMISYNTIAKTISIKLVGGTLSPAFLIAGKIIACIYVLEGISWLLSSNEEYEFGDLFVNKIIRKFSGNNMQENKNINLEIIKNKYFKSFINKDAEMKVHIKQYYDKVEPFIGKDWICEIKTYIVIEDGLVKTEINNSKGKPYSCLKCGSWVVYNESHLQSTVDNLLEEGLELFREKYIKIYKYYNTESNKIKKIMKRN